VARRFVEKHGWTAFAALTSLVWALPLAAWAGAVDFAPDAFFAAFFAACIFPAWVYVAWREETLTVGVPGPPESLKPLAPGT